MDGKNIEIVLLSDIKMRMGTIARRLEINEYTAEQLTSILSRLIDLDQITR